MARPKSQAERPAIEIPPGVRLAFEHRGELLPVRVGDGLAVTAAGEFPRRQTAPRRRKGEEDLGLFAAAAPQLPGPLPPARSPAVLVLFGPGKKDHAAAVSNALWRAGYETELRPDPQTTQEPIDGR